MTSEALAIRENSVPATTGTGFALEGMEGLSTEDMIVPRWDILQPTSRKTGTTGHYCLNLTGETRESIEAVILRVSRTRVLWSGTPGEKAPECSSQDGLTGSVHGECRTCSFNSYDSQGGTLKLCKGGYSYLCAAADNPESLFIISAYGASVSPAKTLNSQFIQRRRSPFTAVVTFKARQEVGERGKYYTHNPAITRWLSPEEYAPFQAVSRMMLGVAVREVEAEAVEAATHVEAQPAEGAKPVEADTTEAAWNAIPSAPVSEAKPAAKKRPF